MIHYIVKRTFEAKAHPKGSEQRAILNCNVITSEYISSYKWALLSWEEDGGEVGSTTFETRAGAEAFAKRIK